MMLWFVLALMTAAAMCAVGWPLAWANRSKPSSGSDLAVYRDQLDEISRDQAAGFIGEAEAQAASIEVSRRLLAAADAQARPSDPPAAAAAKMRRNVAAAALVVVSLGAVSLYLALGWPSLPGQPLSARQNNQSIETLVAQVEAHLAQNPKDGRGWEVIAPVYLRLGRYDDAVKARRNALALSGETSERLADLGEALTAAAEGNVSAEAKAAFERAIALDAENVKARYFRGLAAEQEGRPTEAATIWRGMLAGAPADAPWTQFIRAEIARVTTGGSAPAGPSTDDIAAASDLSPDQRITMIRGMVERLAERLSRDGSDVEGWLRLVRSYMVLGEQNKAREAAGNARRALAREPDKLQRIDELIKGLGLEG